MGFVLGFDYIVDYQEWLRSDPPRFPTWVDVRGAALGLIKLQDIYKLYPEDIVRGDMYAVLYQSNFNMKVQKLFSLPFMIFKNLLQLFHRNTCQCG